MSFNSFCKNIITKMCEMGVSDRANFLKNVGVVGWALSSLAQICAIFFNEKMPAKEKRFLIPQEIFDGIINATLFWFITSKAVSFGKKLVLTKKVLPKSIANIMESFTPNGATIDTLKKNFIDHIKSIGNATQIKTAENAIEGMGVATGVAGAIVANNIVTPLLRNKLAGMWQKKELKKVADNAPLNPYYGKINYKEYDFTKPTKIPTTQNFDGFRTTNMRI